MESADDKGTTIWIPIQLKERLESLKQNKFEPYYSVIQRHLSNGGSGNGEKVGTIAGSFVKK